MADPYSLPAPSWRRVLLVVEDRSLSDLLAEALIEAGHVAPQVDDAVAAVRVLASEAFDAVIVDLDTRARECVGFITRLRAEHPSVTVIALLPCGGLPPSVRGAPYHLAIEKPARLAAILCAVNVAHAAIRN